MAINITGINRAEILATLYNAAKTQGLGVLQYEPDNMTTEEAADIIDKDGYHFDYLKGRVMKIDLSEDILDPWLYDRDNGQGAALLALQKVGLVN